MAPVKKTLAISKKTEDHCPVAVTTTLASGTPITPLSVANVLDSDESKPAALGDATSSLHASYLQDNTA
jgi:hypothetical protein